MVQTRRSTAEASGDVITEQPQFPEFILLEVLDIFHAEREAALEKFFALDWGKSAYTSQYLDIQAGAVRVFTIISLVHRSWTVLAQKQLGRILYIVGVSWQDDLRFPHPALFGPWTTSAFIHLPDYDVFDDSEEDVRRYMNWLRNLMLKFTKFRRLYITKGESGTGGKVLGHFVNKLYGEVLMQNPDMRVLQLHSLDTEGNPGLHCISLDPLLAASSISKLDIINFESDHISDKEKHFTAGFKSLKRVNFYLATQSDIDVLFNLLSFMTTIDHLLISERHTLFPFGEVPVTWGMDQLASLEIWPRLRKLHVFSSYADSLRNWIWPILSLCSGLQEFVLHPVMCASPAGLLLLPRTIRYIEILLPFFWTVEDFPIIKQWLATLYEMLDPSRRPNLAFLVVNLPEVVEKELICVAAFAQLDDRA